MVPDGGSSKDAPTPSHVNVAWTSFAMTSLASLASSSWSSFISSRASDVRSMVRSPVPEASVLCQTLETSRRKRRPTAQTDSVLTAMKARAPASARPYLPGAGRKDPRANKGALRKAHRFISAVPALLIVAKLNYDVENQKSVSVIQTPPPLTPPASKNERLMARRESIKIKKKICLGMRAHTATQSFILFPASPSQSPSVRSRCVVDSMYSYCGRVGQEINLLGLSHFITLHTPDNNRLISFTCPHAATGRTKRRASRPRRSGGGGAEAGGGGQEAAAAGEVPRYFDCLSGDLIGVVLSFLGARRDLDNACHACKAVSQVAPRFMPLWIGVAASSWEDCDADGDIAGNGLPAHVKPTLCEALAAFQRFRVTDMGGRGLEIRLVDNAQYATGFGIEVGATATVGCEDYHGLQLDGKDRWQGLRVVTPVVDVLYDEGSRYSVAVKNHVMMSIEEGV